MATQAKVKHSFTYKDGILIWKNISPYASRAKVGDVAGFSNGRNYLQVGLEGKTYQLHSLVYLYHKGYIPKIIDHIDGDTLNNKIENLRGCTVGQNICNSGLRKDNKTGIKNVTWNAKRKKWVVQVKYNGNRFFGRYENIVLAEAAAIKARIDLHGVFVNHGGV